MPRIVENAILIYTDGSLYPKGRRGGYGLVIVHVDAVGQETVIDRHAPPGISGTTGNRMELQACITALEMAPALDCFDTVGRVVIRSDSRYVVNFFKSALGFWGRNRWRNQAGKPVENADLWKDFVKAYRKVRKHVDLEWVKGHGKGRDKDPYNIAADELARASAKSPLSRPVFRSSVRRKKSSRYTRRGSVEMLGQRMVIYVVEVQWLRVQKVWKYRYQVASKDSPYHENMDLIFSLQQMRDGHYYEVQLNDDSNNPQVLEVIREVAEEEVQ